MSISKQLIVLIVTTPACTTAAPPAHACGGTFCDSGPSPMPVDQTGENILFVNDGEYIEAHVQIQYEGEAERFAWMVPMQAVPEVSVGSQPLFTSLLARTVPTYLTTTVRENCGTTTAAKHSLPSTLARVPEWSISISTTRIGTLMCFAA